MPEMIRLICRTSCSNDFNADCDFAVIELTPQVLKTMQDRIKLHQKVYELDTEVTSMEFYYLQFKFFKIDHDSELGEKLDSLFADTSDWAEIDEPIPDEWIQRTECDRMVVTQSYPDVCFKALPKHCDFWVETQVLTVNDLDEYGKRLVGEGTVSVCQK